MISSNISRFLISLFGIILFAISCSNQILKKNKSRLITNVEESTPYLVHRKNTVIFNYFTSETCETAIFFSDDKNSLEKLNSHHIDELRSEGELEFDDDLFGKMILTKPGGSIDWSLKEPFVSSFHRIQIGKNKIKKYYILYVGKNNFSTVFSSPTKSNTLNSFALLNHTRAEKPTASEIKFYDKSIVHQISSHVPEYLFHSGDFVLSSYNLELIKEETLNLFKEIIPSTPIILSFSNHDTGWPFNEAGYAFQENLFKFFIPFNTHGAKTL